MYKQTLLILGLCLLGSLHSRAQDSIPVTRDFREYTDYNFKVSPFFWYLGLKGEIIAPPRPVQLPEPPPRFEVDLSFSDIRSSLRFFIMLGTEYKTRKFIVKANVTSLILQGEAVTPFQIITEGIDYRFNYLTSEIVAGYRVFNTHRINLDAMLGVRMLATRIEARTDVADYVFEGERSVFWYDPIVALQFKYIPTPRLELMAYLDFGPIRDISSKQEMLQVTYHFSHLFSTALGYRNYFVDSEDDDKDTIYTGRVFGPFIRFGFQF